MTIDRVRAALADRYRIDSELGAGGMATVYLAQDIKHDRKVAVKVLREDLSASLGGGRFLREITIAAQLQHPNILPLLDSGEAGGFLFYVMPYVAGQSLRERLTREGELPIHEAVRLIIEVVDALAHAHQLGVVHRDIKPDNIMLSGRHALVADFGVAKAVSEATGRNTVTTLGVAVGTPTYMSPEQAAADPHVDHRSDIYAVGVMAYELVSGRPPFTGATPQQVLAAHVTEEPDPVTRRRPAISPALNAIIMRCLAKRPADRFQTAGELLAQLEVLATPSGGMTPTTTRPIAAVRRPSRPRWVSGAVVAGVLVVGSLAYWRARGAHDASVAAQAIAVLPFDNVAHDTASDYLAAGVANDLRSGLMKLSGLTVKARTSSEAARGKPVHDAGALLHVGAVVQGTYRRTATGATVTVDLVNVADESELWSGSFALPPDGNFAGAQDSITRAVAKALKLGGGEQNTAQLQRGTANNDAYDRYLKGQYFFAKRGAENLQRSIDYYKQAVVLDPRFARALAGLAMSYSVLPSYAPAVNADSIMREADRFARQALLVDSTLSDAHLALANALTGELQPAAAEPEFLAAIALDPRNATAHQWHGDNLAVLARSDEAVKEGRTAVDLDPLSAIADNDLAYVLLSAGRFDEAATVAHREWELDSTLPLAYTYLGLALAFSGKGDSAQHVLDHILHVDSLAPEARAYYVWRFGLAGRWTEADREVAAVNRTITGGSHDLDMAIGYLAVGNKGAALDALERAVHQRSFYVATATLGCDPTYSVLKTEPRFIALVKEAGQGLCANTPKWPIPVRPK